MSKANERGSALFLIFLACSLAGSNSMADCRLTLGAPNALVALTDLNPSPPIEITVQRAASSESCLFSIVMSRGSASTYSRSLVSASSFYPFNIYKTNSASSFVLKDRDDIVSLNEVIEGRFDASDSSNTKSFFFYPRISPLTPATLVKSGLYQDAIQARVFLGHPPSLSEVESSQLTFRFRYEVPKITALAFDGAVPDLKGSSAGTKVVEFGEIRQGSKQSVDVSLIFNAGYRLSMTSLYGQKLKHATRDAYVPYSVKVDGRSVDISSSSETEVASGNGVTSSGSIRTLPVEITIGTFRSGLAGRYSDRILLTLQSME